MATINEAECWQRIEALERLNATLATEVDRLRCEYGEEVDEFNAGFAAAEQGLPDTAEPSHVKYDVWKCGYAWGRYPALVEQVKRMRPVVDAAIKWNETNYRNQQEIERTLDALGDTCDNYQSAMVALAKGERQ